MQTIEVLYACGPSSDHMHDDGAAPNYCGYCSLISCLLGDDIASYFTEVL